jgi:GT2 family glycosyltransferase
MTGMNSRKSNIASEKLVILIPNYNGEAFILRTLALLSAALPGVDVVVVDDASTDDSVKVLESLNVEVVKRFSNGGFAAAVNTGLKFAQAKRREYVLVCNSDLLPSPEQGAKVLNALDEYMGDMVGVIGFIESDEIVIGDRPSSDISGFLFWLKVEILNETGFFDERFYAYGEETDFFRRVINSGYNIVESGVVVSHETEMSAKSKFKSSWYAIRNCIFLEIKNQCYLEAVRKIGALLLVMWWVRGNSNDASTLRVRRPGILIGPLMLLGAIGWNVWHIIWLKKTRNI